MGRTRSLGIALLAVAGLGLLVVLFRGLGGERGLDGSVVPLDGDASVVELERAPIAAETVRREAPVSKATADVPGPVATPANEPRAPAEGALVLAFDGGVVDPGERPLAEAEVRLLDGRVLTRSEESGRVEATLELAPGDRDPRGARSVVLEIGAAGFACQHVLARLEPGVSLHLGTVRLARGGEVRGRVLGADGKPRAASVSWRYADERPHDEKNVADARRNGVRKQRAPPWRELESDAEGRFHLRGVPEGELFLVAWAEGHAHGWSETFVVRAGALMELDVTLPLGERRLVRVHGRVLDPERRPAAGVTVEAKQGWLGGLSLVSDALGAFDGSLELDPTAAPLRVVARDPELRGYPAEVQGGATEAGPLELVLGSPTFFEVRLVDEHGEPVPDGQLSVSGDGPDAALPAGRVHTDRAGTAHFLVPRVPFALVAMAPGFSSVRQWPLGPADVTSPLVVTLHPGQSVSGRVVVGARPLAGARIGLQRTGDPKRLSMSIELAKPDAPFLALGSAPWEAKDALTAGDGRFVITVPADQWHAIVVEAEGYPTTLFGPFSLQRELGLQGLELEILPAGTLEGRVLVPPGSRSTGRLVGASNGWSFAHTTEVDAQGRYRIEGLAPGSYQVRECLPPAASRVSFHTSAIAGVELVWDTEVRPGATTHFDLDLRGEEDFVLEGRLVLPEGSSGWRAELRRESGAKLCAPPVSLGLVGEFRFALGRGGEVLLFVTNGEQSFGQRVALAPGLNPWTLDPAWAELRLEGLGMLTDTQSLEILRDEEGQPSYRRQLPFERGFERTTLAVPAGRLRVQLSDFNTIQGEVSVETRAGESATIDVRALLQPR